MGQAVRHASAPLAVGMNTFDGPWEVHAHWWQHGFTEGADPEYAELVLPLAAECLAGAGRVLDVGCGEGQVSRLAARLGATPVVGVDPSSAQITEARARAGGPVYARSCAEALPFADGAFDAAIACLVFDHVVAVDAAVAEIARVLEPSGRFLFLVNHPLLQTPASGWVDDQVVDPPQQYWRLGSYLTEVEMVEEVADGVSFSFVHRPLSRYVNTMAGYGLLIERMEEPAPPPGFLARFGEPPASATIPRLLLLLTRKLR